MANPNPQAPVFTAQDLANIFVLIDNASIPVSQAEIVVELKNKLRAAIDAIPQELPADTKPLDEFVADQRPAAVKKTAKKAAKTAKKR